MADCDIKKIDSNVTGLRYAEEECIGQLPGAGVVWKAVDPNSYADFGGQPTSTARAPITESRQRKKGSITDLDASGGFNVDFTQTSLQDLLQGFMFADTRTKNSYTVTGAAGDFVVVADANEFPTITSTTLDFTTLELIPGEWIYVGGDDAGSSFVESENNGFKRIRSIAAHILTFDKSVAPMVAEAGAGLEVQLFFGRVLKNENTRALIKRRSYQLERTLGSLDGLDPPQSEYMIGAVANELSINLQTADKMTADVGFVGIDMEQRTQAQGLKAGTRPAMVESDMFNTSSDVVRFKLSEVVGDNAVPSPMFSFLQEGTLTINNGITVDKAIGVLGGFDVSVGDFAVSGTLTAYFSDIAAVQAVRNNADITLDMITVKKGVGTVFDLPLISLGDGRPNVTKDEAITLPLSMDAATAVKLGADFDYTAMWVFFDTLPEIASTLI